MARRDPAAAVAATAGVSSSAPAASNLWGFGGHATTHHQSAAQVLFKYDSDATGKLAFPEFAPSEALGSGGCSAEWPLACHAPASAG